MIKWLINVILPQRCVLCGKFLSNISDQSLCNDCWNQLKFITPPLCYKCGRSFNVALTENFTMNFKNEDDNLQIFARYLICNICKKQTKKIYYKKIRAVFHYENQAVKYLIKKFKYCDDLKLYKIFVKWLVFIYQEMMNDIDIVVPVPLHKRKLIIRRYNQSAIIAKLFSKTIHKTVLENALIRTKNVVSQSKNSMEARWTNVDNIFAINDKLKSQMQGKRILLIDDVVTTSATANECAKVLIADGMVKSVEVLAIARTSKLY